MPEHTGDGEIRPFRTDDQFAHELRVSARQLEQLANGLDHLQQFLPTMMNGYRAQATHLERLADELDPPRHAVA